MLALVWQFWQWGNGEQIGLLIYAIVFALILALFVWIMVEEKGWVAGSIIGVVIVVIFGLVVYFPFAKSNQGYRQRLQKQISIATFFRSEYRLDVVKVELDSDHADGIGDQVLLKSSCGDIWKYHIVEVKNEQYEIDAENNQLVKGHIHRRADGFVVPETCPAPHEESPQK